MTQKKMLIKALKDCLDLANDIEDVPKPPTYDVSSIHYREGFVTGFTWCESYIPGGPFVFHAKDFDSEEAMQAARESQVAAKNWNTGFKDGLATRNAIWGKEPGDRTVVHLRDLIKLSEDKP